MNIIISKYRKWKRDNPCTDYQYDEIKDFLAELSRGELLLMMEHIDNTLQQEADEEDDELWREPN